MFIAIAAAAAAAAAAAKSLQSCPTLCDPIHGSPPGSSVHGSFQARVLEWVAIAFSLLAIINILKFVCHRNSQISLTIALLSGL